MPFAMAPGYVFRALEPGKRRTLASAIGLTPRWLFAHIGWDSAYSSFLF